MVRQIVAIVFVTMATGASAQPPEKPPAGADKKTIKAYEKELERYQKNEAKLAKEQKKVEEAARKAGMTVEDLQALVAEPLSFIVPKAGAADAWGRAQAFVGQWSSMKIQTATDYIVQTFTPTGSDILFGYQITRSPGAEGDTFDVRCTYSNMFTGNDALANAKIAARFIRTGVMPCQNCVRR